MKTLVNLMDLVESVNEFDDELLKAYYGELNDSNK